MVFQGSVLSDSVLGVTTPGRRDNTGGVYFYRNLSYTNPQTSWPADLELGLTKAPSVSAHLVSGSEGNVPSNPDSLYGEWVASYSIHWCTHWCSCSHSTEKNNLPNLQTLYKCVHIYWSPTELATSNGCWTALVPKMDYSTTRDTWRFGQRPSSGVQKSKVVES